MLLQSRSLATAVSLAPQFLLRAKVPQYIALEMTGILSFVHRTQRFGNWICLRPQVRGLETPTLLGLLETAPDSVIECVYMYEVLYKICRSRSKKERCLNSLNYVCHLLQNSLLGNVYSDSIIFFHASKSPWK
jgi:hypothetical protein